jgi:UDP-N-acetylglucosamine 4,6-dehydratase/5-epimerase
MQNGIKNKRILVTGGTGSIGSLIVKQLLKHEPEQVRIFSRDENKQYYLMEELGYPENVRLLIGDIRDKDRLKLAFENVDTIFHAAAMKHVSLCEYNPFEVVKTNIVGSQNVIDAAMESGVKKVIGISTDKAVNPVNVLGTSKLMMEKLFINANYYKKKPSTIFSCVRFGNVAWSVGSVLPLWKKQAEKNGELTVTDSEMTRFFMSTEQAANLTIKASDICMGGEMFILKMPAIRLTDLAVLFIKKYYPGRDIKLKNRGKRPGEKIHEELFDENDLYKKILENEDMFIMLPESFIQDMHQDEYAHQGFREAEKVKKYSSENYIDIARISKII